MCKSLNPSKSRPRVHPPPNAHTHPDQAKPAQMTNGTTSHVLVATPLSCLPSPLPRDVCMEHSTHSAHSMHRPPNAQTPGDKSQTALMAARIAVRNSARGLLSPSAQGVCMQHSTRST